MSGNEDGRAMRIMEALSDVDEELLERSERAAGSKRSGKSASDGRMKGSLWQRSKAWAAVLCLAVAGGMAWGGYQLGRGGGENNSANYSGMMQGGTSQENAMPNASEGSNIMSPSSDKADAAGIQSGLNSGNDGAENMPTDIKLGSSFVSGEPSQGWNITEEEARSLEKVGSYVPAALPKGYVFLYAHRGIYADEPGEGADWLEISWVRGEDRIVLLLREAEDAQGSVDVSNPEAYDVRLYRKPYNETVPEEYRAVFDDPIFSLKDFDEEIVKSRMNHADGNGKDTGASEGNFSVLYPDNVLVQFSGAGTAEEIWEMFCSIGDEGIDWR